MNTVVVYNSEYPIHNVDRQIRENLSIHVNEQIKEAEFQIKELQMQRRKCTMGIRAIRDFNTQIARLQKKIQELKKQEKKYDEYINETKDLLDQFQKFAIRNVEFGAEPSQEEEREDKEQLRIIENFFSICRKYSNIIPVRKMEKDDTCPECHEPMKVKEHLLVCSKCSIEQVQLSVTNITTSDFDSANSCNISEKEDVKNLIETMLKIQGKHSEKPPANVYKQLDKYFQSKGMMTSEEIQKQDLNDDGTRGPYTIDHLQEGLKKTGNNKLYPHLNLIAYEYWSWPLPDFSHIEEKIISDYLAIRSTCYSVSSDDQKSAINTVFKLKQILLNNGFKCRNHHFSRTPTSTETVEKYRRHWKNICDIEGLQYYPF